VFIESPRFPDDIAHGARSTPGYRTEVTELEGGTERRNSLWANARHRYDAAYGVRSISDLEAVTAFFHAMRGAAHSFRFKDWADYKSCGALATPADTDQALGTGDDAAVEFALVKRYTVAALETVRPIEKPVAGSVVVAVDGVPQASGWSVDTATGVVTFDTPPAAGLVVSAGFEFDVPVRFAEDHLPQALDCYMVGSIELLLIEVRGE
jgi:uncharacterized protein (TIGR02217 family)